MLLLFVNSNVILSCTSQSNHVECWLPLAILIHTSHLIKSHVLLLVILNVCAAYFIFCQYCARTTMDRACFLLERDGKPPSVWTDFGVQLNGHNGDGHKKVGLCFFNFLCLNQVYRIPQVNWKNYSSCSWQLKGGCVHLSEMVLVTSGLDSDKNH